MKQMSFLSLSDSEKKYLWNIFHHEDLLLSELDFYEDKIRSIGKPKTSIDIAVLTIYKKHIKNIHYLLDKIFDSKQSNLRIAPYTRP